METDATREYDDALRSLEALARVARADRAEIEAEFRSVRLLWPLAAIRVFEHSRQRIGRELERVEDELERAAEDLARLRRCRQWREAGDVARLLDRLRAEELALRSRLERDRASLVHEARSGIVRGLEVSLELVADRTRREVERLMGEIAFRVSSALQVIDDYERLVHEVSGAGQEPSVLRALPEDVEALRRLLELSVRFERREPAPDDKGRDEQPEEDPALPLDEAL